MSREQDLLFCKIAIANGLVTEEQAKKALAIVNQREQESGRRPMIGAIFSKYNLMDQRNVQALYQAVNKRLGTSAPAPGQLPAGGRGGARASHATRGRGAPRKAPKKVDPQTLWMGIGFGVVFLGIIIGLVATWVVYDPKDEGAEEQTTTASAGSGAGGSGESSSAAARGGASSTSSATSEAAESSSASTGDAQPKMADEVRSKIEQALKDSRLDFVDGNVQRAHDRLDAALADIEKKKIYVDAALLTQLKADRDGYKGDGAPDADEGLGDDLGDDLGDF